MPLVVSSAAGVNGDGYGALLAFEADGSPRGVFSHDQRIRDPRGLAFGRNEGLLFVNSGAGRMLALDANGHVVRDTGPIAGLNPGGGNFAPDGRLRASMIRSSVRSTWRLRRTAMSSCPVNIRSARRMW